MTKREIFKKYGIEFKDELILSPLGWIRPLLKEGNTKTGKKCYTFSLPAGTEGTCVCDCPDCYAKTGKFRCENVKASLSRNKLLIENYFDFAKRAIQAQIESEKIEMVRIHAAGDFNVKNSDEYASLWVYMVKTFSNVRFWTYTKMQRFETLFDGFSNANIVPSILPYNQGFNFGTCEEILSAYETLLEKGIKAYICECGVNDNMHCDKCAGCSVNRYVLFLKHSAADYNAKKDPLLPEIVKIIEKQRMEMK